MSEWKYGGDKVKSILTRSKGCQIYEINTKIDLTGNFQFCIEGTQGQGIKITYTFEYQPQQRWTTTFTHKTLIISVKTSIDIKLNFVIVRLSFFWIVFPFLLASCMKNQDNLLPANKQREMSHFQRIRDKDEQNNFWINIQETSMLIKSDINLFRLKSVSHWGQKPIFFLFLRKFYFGYNNSNREFIVECHGLYCWNGQSKLIVYTFEFYINRLQFIAFS